MTTDKRELAVAALQSGTVIDHIPSDALFKCVKILELGKLPRRVEMPEVIKGIVKCDNPKCITNNEPMQTVFYMAEDGEHIRCRYCNHAVANGKANIL